MMAFFLSDSFPAIATFLSLLGDAPLNEGYKWSYCFTDNFRYHAF